VQGEHADRAGHVVQIEVAEIDGTDQRIGADLRLDTAGHRDPARFCIGLQPGGDIHRIAIDVAAIDDDVSDIHADAQADATVRQLAKFGGSDGALYLQRTRDCRANIVEDHQRSIAGVLDQGPPVRGNARREFRGAEPHEPLIGGALIRRHQPAVADHIGGENSARLLLGLRGVHSAPLRACNALHRPYHSECCTKDRRWLSPVQVRG